ncbi:MAG TPA: septal ring lytic transglycosylase RlpA family protein [Burkholderiales bacterium]|nr:septal ring lytic transglycosylase RlpA family protein [Burkholderiales bacterium]
MKATLFLCIAAVILAGCAEAPVNRTTAPVSKTPVHESPHYSKGGGYYLDDGPGAHPPSNIAAIPDAMPRKEALIASCNRPYTAMGKAYYPETKLETYRAEGVASWYGRRYNGQKTSSGEVYDMYAMTAAHPTLPIPSYARVTNLSSGKSVIVRINDRGPFRSDRLIDLSYTAAYKLGILKNGSARVKVESILPGAGEENAAEASASPAGSLYLQLGAFSEKLNAQHFIELHKTQLEGYSPEIVGSGGIYRVHVGPYSSREDASNAAQQIAQVLDITPVISTR